MVTQQMKEGLRIAIFTMVDYPFLNYRFLAQPAKVAEVTEETSPPPVFPRLGVVTH
jgi:hypothetical protein